MTSFAEINDAILSCTMPSSGDGVSNYERAAFIAYTFEVDTIDLTEEMPFEAALDSDDAEGIEAAAHYAKLQFQFVHACAFANLIPQPDAELNAAFIHLWIKKLTWHLQHVQKGRPTPPYSFIH